MTNTIEMEELVYEWFDLEDLHHDKVNSFLAPYNVIVGANSICIAIYHEKSNQIILTDKVLKFKWDIDFEFKRDY